MLPSCPPLMNGCLFEVFEKFTRYFEVEPKWVANRPGHYTASTDDLIAACDENTIGAPRVAWCLFRSCGVACGALCVWIITRAMNKTESAVRQLTPHLAACCVLRPALISTSPPPTHNTSSNQASWPSWGPHTPVIFTTWRVSTRRWRKRTPRRAGSCASTSTGRAAALSRPSCTPTCAGARFACLAGCGGASGRAR